MGKIVSLNISAATGTAKEPVDSVAVRPDHGMEGDAHAGNWHRQISLLAQESIDTMKARGFKLSPGDFAENITTRDLNLTALPVGTRLVSGEVELEITQIGKKCHTKCTIYNLVGDCIMPRQGVFAKVVKGGVLHRSADINIKETGG